MGKNLLGLTLKDIILNKITRKANGLIQLKTTKDRDLITCLTNSIIDNSRLVRQWKSDEMH